jgi:hypothetical protein
MNKPLRRQERKLNDDETLEILRNGEYGVLSMCTPGNYGYGVPLNYTMQNNAIYFHCAMEGSKLDYLRANNKVSFCVVGNTKLLPAKFSTLYESAIVFGTTSEIDGEEKRNALIHLTEKYSSDHMQEGLEYIERAFERTNMIKLSIESFCGKGRKE